MSATLEQALGHLQSGRLREAEALYRQILRADPENVDALHLLGVAVFQDGRGDEAVGFIERSLHRNPGNADALNNLGQVYELLDRRDDAVDAYRKAVAAVPGFAPALANLGDALLRKGEAEEAVDCLKGALQAFADDPDVLGGLGKALAAVGRADEAVVRLRRARDIAPRDPAVLCNLGIALQAKGDVAEAEAAFEAAVALDPGFAEGHYNLGLARQDQGRLDAAAASYGRALEIDPAHIMAHVNLGLALLDLGQVDDAVASYRRAIEAVPEHAEAYHNLSLLKTFEAGDADLAAMEALRARPGLGREQAMFLDFALAKAFDELGEPDRAFLFMASGNRLKRAMVDFDFAREEALVARVIGVFDKALLERRGADGLADPTPIFIVGMPRSGTTLVEQILASHSRVFGAGELKHLRDVVTGRGGAGPGVEGLSGGRAFPEGVADLDAGALRRLGEAYVALLRGEDAAPPRITDKMPGNFLYLGLIHLALPEARIVHCVRNPVDTCLSCYQILFSSRQNFSYDLGELGRYYRLYARLMDHWRRVLPGRILDVRYEELVAEPEAGMRALVGFCGLDWEDACLRFHDSDRPIRTASAQQVRRPIYKTAVARWRRYEKHLGPLVEALGPLAKDG